MDDSHGLEGSPRLITGSIFFLPWKIGNIQAIRQISSVLYILMWKWLPKPLQVKKICECFICMYEYLMCVDVHRGQIEELNTLQLKLQIVVSHHMRIRYTSSKWTASAFDNSPFSIDLLPSFYWKFFAQIDFDGSKTKKL